MKLFISPHNDDETLFGAFTLIRERKGMVVAVVTDSYIQPSRGCQGCDMQTRRIETVNALDILLGTEPQNNRMFLGVKDNELTEQAVKTALITLLEYKRKAGIEHVWLPAVEEGGFPHHNLIGKVGREVFKEFPITSYMTYTTHGKSRSSFEVAPQSGEDIALKHKALACYVSQMQLGSGVLCWPHFVDDLREYIAG